MSESAVPRPNERADRFALAACLAVAAALRLWNLGAPDLWSDEVHTYDAMHLPAGELVFERLRAGHLPLYFVTLRGWAELFGTSQFALRLPSALLGTALVLPAFAFFRRLLAPPAARWALALTAVHPLLVELSREARMYSLLALLFLVAAEATAAALDEGRVPAKFWIAVALGPLVHPTWAFAVLPLAFLAARERRASAASRRLLVGLLGSVGVLGAALAFADAQHPELLRRPWAKELLAFAIRPHLGTSSLGMGVLALAGGVCLWGLWSAVGLAETAPRARRLALALLLGVPGASLLVGLLGGFAWGPARYLQPAAFGAILLAAAGLGAVAPASPRRLRDHRGWLLVLYLAVLSVNEACFARGTGWSEAAERLRGEGGPVVVEEAGGRVVLAHYLEREVLPARPAAAGAYWRASVGRDHRATVERIDPAPVTPR